MNYGAIFDMYVGGGTESFQQCSTTCHTTHPGSGLSSGGSGPGWPAPGSVSPSGDPDPAPVTPGVTPPSGMTFNFN
jgi:hypothetical protein